MTYVAAAYLVTLGILGAYALSLWLRQRSLRRGRGGGR